MEQQKATHIGWLKRLGAALVALLVAGALTLMAGCAPAQKADSDNTSKSTAAQTEQQQKSNAGDSSSTKADDQSNQDSSSSSNTKKQQGSSSGTSAAIDENGSYTSKEEVALYIHTYGKLPGNFITKKQAKKAGWVASKGNLQKVCPGKSIGGDTFYNDEGELPEAKGRTYKECDIDYAGGRRGAKRIVFSNDGLVFYTADHYNTFEQLY